MPDNARIAELRVALNGGLHPPACEAARALGKLGIRARDAVDDLLTAASQHWEFGCPQRYCCALEALLKIAPGEPRIVAVIRSTIFCSNYGSQKASVLALAQIGSKEAIETIYHIDRYWRASPKSTHFKKLIYKVLGELESKGLDKLLGDPSFARAQLIEWLQDRRLGPPCPHCGAALRTSAAKQCFHCGRDWHDQVELKRWP